jgi:lipoprotein-anchoring transpeptidase ErfK/SrfK
MRMLSPLSKVGLLALFVQLSACSYYSPEETMVNTKTQSTYSTGFEGYKSYESRLPSTLDTNGQKTILIDPNTHAWGAYSADGSLVRAGLVTAGASYCPDVGRACKTKAGTFRIQSLGSPACKSSKYPVGKGGAPMPYCMFFNGHQGLHGSYEVVEANLSHGCVRLKVPDAEWIRYNFANIGTRVVVKPY